ncbi:hypothetical protein BV25DRAFT_1812930 [Artomyces pyxidatus]|uniref:Uncharacterized protein n=1 Tax=Artomyces pyxidatus TaxID=48021 RepID=A0ACB8SMC1_9AGAM|nr:hypothetical protein BV25DRAFT_1812930 [Artomyces pyxidatus]
MEPNLQAPSVRFPQSPFIYLFSSQTDQVDTTWELIFSLPSTRKTKLATFAINTTLLLFAADFAFYPLLDTASDVVFTRIGAVYPDAAKVVVRYPHVNGTEHNVQILWRRATSTVEEAWTDGPTLHLNPDHDWANTTKLSGLWPNTEYEYILANVNKTVLDYPATPIRFRTFPDPRLPTGSHFRFVVSSCLTPNFPYKPLQGRTIKGFDLLADYLFDEPKAATPIPEAVVASDNATEVPIPVETNDGADVELNATAPEVPEVAPAVPVAVPEIIVNETVVEAAPKTEFLMLLGDFIYADVPIYFGDDVEAYRRLYRRNYQSPSFRRVYEKLPIIHTYDDHEIINNYAGQSNDTAPFANADEPFKIYNSDANYDSPAKDQHYFDFRYGDVAFFVMDTRRYRSDALTEEVATRTMLGEAQLTALYEWLGKVNQTATFKFIVTSVPFTSLWTHEAVTDSWAGFTHEKAAILSALHTVPNVIMLSGDRHEFAAVQFTGASEDAEPVYEFSTSPLSMFYVPLIRTLKPQSEETVNRTRMGIVDEGGELVEIVDEVPQEKVLKYLPIGNYKWSAIEVDTRNLDQPTLKLEVMIDGEAQYHLAIVGKPVKLKSNTSLGALVPDGIKELLDRVGLKPSRWF